MGIDNYNYNACTLCNILHAVRESLERITEVSSSPSVTQIAFKGWECGIDFCKK